MRCLIFFLATVAYAQTLTVYGPGNVKSGSTFNLTVSLSGTVGSSVQAIQFSVSGIAWTARAVDSVAGKTLSCVREGTLWRCLLTGGSAPLPEGTVATFVVTIPKFTPGNTDTIAISEQLGVSTEQGTTLPKPLNAVPFRLKHR